MHTNLIIILIHKTHYSEQCRSFLIYNRESSRTQYPVPTWAQYILRFQDVNTVHNTTVKYPKGGKQPFVLNPL